MAFAKDMAAFIRAHLMLIGVLVLGIVVRLYCFPEIPLGLNLDEASMGYDAYALLHYGIDRNGFSYPLHLVGFGSGVGAFAAYTTIPTVALLGLSIFSIRLPALLFGIVSLLLFYTFVSRLENKRTALIALFLLVISPWHIMVSRWALDCNYFPHLFLSGVVCLEGARRKPWLFPLACGFFGLSLYAYSAAYAVVPVFLLLIALYHRKEFPPLKPLITGVFILCLTGLPILLFLLINTFHWESIAFGIFSIPRLPSQPRYEGVTEIGRLSTHIFAQISTRFGHLLHLLITQDDKTYYNVLPKSGYIYHISLLFFIIGVIASIVDISKKKRADNIFILAWIIAALALSFFLKDVNINRMNVVFFPLIYIIAKGISACASIRKIISAVNLIPLIILIYFFCFTQFLQGYFSKYKENIGHQFSASVTEVLTIAEREAKQGVICITDQIRMPYIYALFTDKTDPYTFLNTVHYSNPGSPFQNVRSFGRFVFGLRYCPVSGVDVIVATNGEADNFSSYKLVDRIRNYSILIPR